MDEALAQEQVTLTSRVVIPDRAGYEPRNGDVVAGLDVQYAHGQAFVGGHLTRWNEGPIGTFAGVLPCDVPYSPGYLCFREGPPLVALLERLAAESLPAPDLIVVDGHGIAHPRRFGVACWLGVATGYPTIGCAKESLLKYAGQLGKPRGSTLQVRWNDQTVGYVLRTQDAVRPIFVSPGHLVRLDMAVTLALGLTGSFRIPDPLRYADHAARGLPRGLREPTWQDLGRLSPVAEPRLGTVKQ